jgi:uncharacterized protein YjeT (DUF2065 family)
VEDLLFAAGAVLAVEGFLLAMAPDRLRALLATMDEIGPERLRLFGLGAAAIGVALIALTR